MGAVVGAVGDGAQRGQWHAVVVADLRDGGAFHFHGQRVGQALAQRLAFGAGGDEAVSAGDQAFVLARRVQREFPHRRIAQRIRRVRQHLGRSGEQAVVEVLALDELLTSLHALDERAAQVVELRYFGGYTEVEVAGMLDISESTLRRDWRRARAFLMKEMAA